LNANDICVHGLITKNSKLTFCT